MFNINEKVESNLNNRLFCVTQKLIVKYNSQHFWSSTTNFHKIWKSFIIIIVKLHHTMGYYDNKCYYDNKFDSSSTWTWESKMSS